MKNYNLWVPQSYANLFLAWDLGNNTLSIKETLGNLPTDHRGWYDFAELSFRRTFKKHWKRSDLEKFAGFVREVVAYQQGKMGKNLVGLFGVVCVREELNENA